jgi:hypothetical protein
MADDRDYMSIWEFSQLPPEAHHAVWKAHADGLIDAIPATDGQPDGIQRYHAEQVRAILAGLAVSRG